MTPTDRAWTNRLLQRLTDLGATFPPAITEAFRRVPRHRFLESFYRTTPNGPPELIALEVPEPADDVLDLIYSNTALPTRWRDGRPTSSTSEPGLMATMLGLLDLAPGMRVLEIGAGTGYNAALIAEIVRPHGRIVSIDIQEDVAAQARRLLTAAGYHGVTVLARDGAEGAPEHAPFDRIIVTAGCPDLSPLWAEQLAPDGLIVAPLTHGGFSPLVRVHRDGDALTGEVAGFSGFMDLQGSMAGEDPWHRQFFATVPDLTNARELPPLPGLTPEPHQPIDWDAYAGFYYYLAVRDHRIAWSGNPYGFGLAGPDLGAVLITRERGAVLLAGDDALYDDLLALHAEWQALGSPTLAAYRLTFRPHAEPAPPPAEHEWTVDRVHHRQTIRIAAPA